MRIVPAAVSVGLLCAVTAACGSNSETVSDAVPRTMSAATPAPSNSDQPGTGDPQAASGLIYAAPPDRPLALGEAWQWTSTARSGAKATGTTAVLAYKQKMSPNRQMGICDTTR